MYVRVLVSGNNNKDIEFCICVAIPICKMYADSAIEMVLLQFWTPFIDFPPCTSDS